MTHCELCSQWFQASYVLLFRYHERKLAEVHNRDWAGKATTNG